MIERIVTQEADGSLTVSPVPGAEECDFCSARPTVKDYEAADFQLHDMTSSIVHPAWSAGQWAACAECAALVDAGDWDGIVVRVAKILDIQDERRLDWLRRTYLRLRVAMAEKGGREH